MNKFKRYEPVYGHFRVGVEAALASLENAARRDSYGIGGELKLLDELSGKVHYLVTIGGEWYEGIGLEDSDEAEE